MSPNSSSLNCLCSACCVTCVTGIDYCSALNSSPFPPQGRGSGFPGRRRSRGGGVGGGRGARGRSRLKTQDSLTVLPGVRTMTLLVIVMSISRWSVTAREDTDRCVCLSVCLSVCVHGAVSAQGGGGEFDAQHGGDVLHLGPLHPQTGTQHLQPGVSVIHKMRRATLITHGRKGG